MKFLIAAANEADTDWISEPVDAGTFEDAWEMLRQLARSRWPAQLWRPTNVTEIPRPWPREKMQRLANS